MNNIVTSYQLVPDDTTPKSNPMYQVSEHGNLTTVDFNDFLRYESPERAVSDTPHSKLLLNALDETERDRAMLYFLKPVFFGRIVTAAWRNMKREYTRWALEHRLQTLNKDRRHLFAQLGKLPRVIEDIEIAERETKQELAALDNELGVSRH